MTHYFDDLLRDANGHLGSDDLWIPESTQFDLWSFTFKAQPKKHLVSNPPLEFVAKKHVSYTFQSIEHGFQKKVDQKEDKEVHSNKTWTKIGYTHDGKKYGFGLESEKFSGSIDYTAFDENNWKVNHIHSAERKPLKGDWKIKNAFNISTPDFSGIRAWLAVRKPL